MSLGYCEKDCTQCALREVLNCPGCQMGPGNEMYGNCGIAACCRGKKLESCGSCDKRVGCTELAVKELLPQRRKTQHAVKQARALVMDRRAPYLGKLLWVLFWLMIGSILVPVDLNIEGLVQLESLFWLSDVIALGMALTVIAMAREEKSYELPGFLLAGLAIHDFLMHLFTVNGEPPLWAILTSMLTPYLAVGGTYLLFTAHAETAGDVGAALPGKWKKLRKWYVVAGIAIEVSNYLVIFAPMPITIAVGIMGIVLVAVEILELVYLARMAKGFCRFKRT